MECYYGRCVSCSDRASEEYIKVNNFGYYKDINTSINVRRQEGRSDYQIIYIERGRGSFWINGELRTIEGGNIVVYRPGEEQLYTFEAHAGAAYYWIHFTGAGAAGLLERLKLNGSVFETGEFFGFRERFEKMMSACRPEDFITEDLLAGCMISILAETAKKLHNEDMSMVRVIETMHNDTADGRCNSDYAKMYGVSEYHFIRKFKSYTGMSPHQYKTKLLMGKACDLLLKTNMNIAEIAETLGYEDSLYFSRVFKKQMGVSPRRFKPRRFNTEL